MKLLQNPHSTQNPGARRIRRLRSRDVPDPSGVMTYPLELAAVDQGILKVVHGSKLMNEHYGNQGNSFLKKLQAVERYRTDVGDAVFDVANR